MKSVVEKPRPVLCLLFIKCKFSRNPNNKNKNAFLAPVLATSLSRSHSLDMFFF